MNFSQFLYRPLLATVAILSASGCASMEAQRNLNPDPNDRLNHMLQLDERAEQRGSQCREIWADRGKTVDCERIAREVDRLYAEFPYQQRVVLTHAFMQHDYGRRDSAQFLLDQLLGQPGSFPEAAILRSQLALAEGNMTRAKSLLKQQIKLAPDHAGLHETLSSVFYLEGQYDKSQHHLNLATILDAPDWRVTYHRGLILEAQDNTEAACHAYQGAAQLKPDFRAPIARLIGLSQHAACANSLKALRRAPRHS